MIIWLLYYFLYHNKIPINNVATIIDFQCKTKSPSFENMICSGIYVYSGTLWMNFDRAFYPLTHFAISNNGLILYWSLL